MEGKPRNPPPTSGQWKPGQSGNPSGRPKVKPLRDAINRLLAANPEQADRIAAALLGKAELGDVAAIREYADRMDGKVPQGIENEGSKPFRMEIGWIQNASSLTTDQDDNSSDTTIEPSDSPVSSPTAEPGKP